MRANRILMEGTDKLYHSTSPHTALKILQDGKFKLTSTTGNPSEENKRYKDYDYYLSTSRTKTGDYHARSYNSGVIMNLDGRWVNERYPVKPIDYWDRMWYNKETGGTYNGRTSETEDRVYSKKPEIPITPLQEIHIFWKEDANPDWNFIVRRLMLEAKKQKYPIYIYDDLKQWLAQNKSKALSVSEAKSRLSGKESKRFGIKRSDPWLEAWLELYYKKNVDELSDKGKRQYRDLFGWGDLSQGLNNDLHNSAKPGSSGYETKQKIIQIMNKHKLKNATEFIEFLKRKWEPIKELKRQQEMEQWHKEQEQRKLAANESSTFKNYFKDILK